MKKIISILFVSLAIIQSLFAGTRDPNIPDEKYIELGEKFKCVGQITGIYNDDTMYSASGVAIDSHRILTAAHVIENNKRCWFIIQNRKFDVSRIIKNEDFVRDQFSNGDIAICYVDQDISLDFYPELYTHNNELKKKCTIVGFGKSGTFDTGPSITDDNIKRAGFNLIEDIDNELLICSPSPPGDDTITEMEFLICAGDSGGGLFIDNKLAGIHSCIFRYGNKQPNAKYGTKSGHTRIKNYIDWINTNR